MNKGSNQEARLQDVTNTCGLERAQHQLTTRHQPVKPRLVITASGFHGQAKQELQQLAVNIGAVYSGSLVHGSTTHLVCKRLIDCFATPKYQRALEWGIQIVTYDWLLASDAAGQPLPEDGYRDDKLESLKPSPRPAKKQQQKQPEPHAAQHAACPEQQPTATTTIKAAPASLASNNKLGCREGFDDSTPALPAEESKAVSPSGMARQLLLQQSPQSNPHKGLQHQSLRIAGIPLANAGQQDQHSQSCLGSRMQLSQHSIQRQQEQCASDDQSAMPQPFSHEQQQEDEPQPQQQQQQQQQQHLCIASQQLSNCGATVGTGSQVFQFAAFDDELASPSLQNFLPLQQHQQGGTGLVSDASACMQHEQLDLVPLRPRIPADIAVATAGASCTLKQERLRERHSLSRQGSSSSMLDCPGCAQRQCSPTSPAGVRGIAAGASPAGSSNPVSLSPDSQALSPEGLLIPETQAELEDIWDCGRTSPPGSTGTPLSLKYYAMQQCSAGRTATRQGDDQETAEAATPACDTRGQKQGAAAVDDQQELPQQQGSDDTADETESDQEDLEQQLQQQRNMRPVSAASCSSSSQPQQQQQQTVFKLTSSSKRISSSGLTRLQRGDGYRRQAGRLLVSEPSDPTEVELQDSDCEFNDELADSNSYPWGEAGCQSSEPYRPPVQQTGVDISHCKLGQWQQRPGSRHSKVHSCSGSSLPAHSNICAAAAAAATQEDDAVSLMPAASAASAPETVTPAASSDSGMPVMKLSFPLGTSSVSVSRSSWSQEPELQSVSFRSAASDNASTPQCTCDSSGYNTSGSSSSGVHGPGSNSQPDSSSSSGSRRRLKLSKRDVRTHGATAAAMMDKRQQLKQQQSEVQQGDNRHAGESQMHDHSQQQHPQQQGRKGPSDSPFPCPPSAVSSFITKRKAGRQCGAVNSRPEHAADAAAGYVAIKQEPSEAAAPADCADALLPGEQQQQPAQLRVKQEQLDPADALLQEVRKQQQPKQVERQPVLKVKVEQEQLDPAEQLLLNLKQRQQQQQPSGGTYLVVTPGSGGDRQEAIDDDSQGAGVWQQQQAKPNRYSSASSFATELSSLSVKVPLRILGDGQQLDCSNVGVGASPLEHMLQVTLADRATAAAACPAGSPAAATASNSMAVKQEYVDWLHTPEEQQQQQQHAAYAGMVHAADGATDSEEDSAFEITGLPTKTLAARNKPITKHLGAHLAHLSQAGGQEQVIPLKLLSKAPRGTTAKAFHGLKPSSKLVYAEQVQVPWAHATFSTKERSRCVIVLEQQPAAPADAEEASSSVPGQQQQGKVFLAEPVAFYKLESGEWWVELQRFYSAKDLRLTAKAADQKLHLPSDFQLSYELLRGMAHEHVSVRQVQGEFKLTRVRKAPPSGRGRVTPFFWRYSFDSSTCQVLTDRPVTDFVMQ